MVNSSFNNMGTFVNSINQDVVLFFDEFEKTYELSSYHDDDEDGGKKSVNSLLTLMDGVFTSEYKRLFLLTTNKVYLPDAMVSRPSRIRYVKEFGDLGLEDIIEILNDSVNDRKLIPQLVDILKELKNITVDIVKSVADEVNIYGVATKEFFEIFNVTKEDKVRDLFEVIVDVNGNTKETLIQSDTQINFDSCYVGHPFRIRSKSINGSIVDIEYDKQLVTIETTDNEKRTFVFKQGVYTHESMTEYTF